MDTSGSLTPQAGVWLTKHIKDLTGKRVEIHTHGDFGMAVATTLACVTAGAEVADVSVAGRVNVPVIPLWMRQPSLQRPSMD